jgi:putative ABC transport system permease protein
LLAGALPALRSAEPRDIAGMGARSTLRWQTSLLTCEVALTLVLLISAGLLIRTFVNLRSARLGYDPQNTLTTFLALPPVGSDPASAELLYDRIRRRLEMLPDVQSGSTASSTPSGGVDMSVPIEPEGSVSKREAATSTVDMISPHYFRTLCIRIKVGRAFTPADRRGGAPVVIISDSIARKYFGGNALGRRLRVPAVNFALTNAKWVWAEVVGVVEDVAVTAVGETTAEHMYLPEAQNPVRFTYLLLRTDRDPMSFGSAVRRAVYAESPATPLDDMESMQDRTAYLTASPRRAMWLLGVFEGLAGVLSATGIYAVSAYLAAQRAREMAIRMAVGAGTLSVTGAICRKPFGSISMGLLFGILSALALTHFLRSLLFGVGSIDFLTYFGASIALLFCALLAMIRPTLRTITMDVASALRQE